MHMVACRPWSPCCGPELNLAPPARTATVDLIGRSHLYRVGLDVKAHRSAVWLAGEKYRFTQKREHDSLLSVAPDQSGNARASSLGRHVGGSRCSGVGRAIGLLQATMQLLGKR